MKASLQLKLNELRRAVQITLLYPGPYRVGCIPVLIAISLLSIVIVIVCSMHLCSQLLQAAIDHVNEAFADPERAVRNLVAIASDTSGTPNAGVRAQATELQTRAFEKDTEKLLHVVELVCASTSTIHIDSKRT